MKKIFLQATKLRQIHKYTYERSTVPFNHCREKERVAINLGRIFSEHPADTYRFGNKRN